MNSNWSYSPETKIWVVTSVTLTFDLWPWPFAWTSLLSLVITPENFMMIGWWEHSQKGVTDRRTDGRTDRRTDWTIHRAAWSQLKIISKAGFHISRHNIAVVEFVNFVSFCISSMVYVTWHYRHSSLAVYTATLRHVWWCHIVTLISIILKQMMISSRVETSKFVTRLFSTIGNHFDIWPPSAAYMRQWIRSALVQIMAFRLFGANP